MDKSRLLMLCSNALRELQNKNKVEEFHKNKINKNQQNKLKAVSRFGSSWEDSLTAKIFDAVLKSFEAKSYFC